MCSTWFSGRSTRRRGTAFVATIVAIVLLPATWRAQTIGPTRILLNGLTPFVQQGVKLVGSGGVGIGGQGISVSVSADGNTALVGATYDNSFAGAAWVWTRNCGVWTQQGQKLVGTGATVGARQGRSVSLSADGNTAFIGAPGDTSFSGAAWAWTRSNGVWTQQGAKLVGSGGVDGSENQAVTLSADGNTALVGGHGDNAGVGSVWVWTRTNGVWTQQGTKLIGSGAVGLSGQGFSIALSADGNTALIGGPGDSGAVGAVWVWTRSGGAWTQQGSKLIGTGSQGASSQGVAVSLSADGNTAMVGGYADNNGAGAAWVWVRVGGVWTQQGPKLTQGGQAGRSVSLSADGNTALIASPSSTGGAWIWMRSGGVWTQHGHKLVGSGGLGSAQGTSVSLSADGHTALVGTPNDNSNVGATWVFTPSPPFDIDGDGKSDRTVFRPSNGVWYSALSGGGATTTGWGVTNDVDVAGDYDGDGKTDIAIWRPSIGAWLIVYSSDSTVHVLTWGTSGDIPLAGDLDGDGKADEVIFRPSTGAWFATLSSGGTRTLGWGLSGDQPLLGDFDHDGRMDPTVFRPSNGAWYAALSGGGSFIVGWGIPGDLPVVGDWDGDGTSDPAIFRPATGDWFVHQSSGGTVVTTWGTAGDAPVSGDWDGDGKSDFTAFRQSGSWFTQLSCGGTEAVGWGVSGDKPSGRAPGS